MGRWLDKIKNHAVEVPAKPAEPVSMVLQVMGDDYFEISQIQEVDPSETVDISWWIEQVRQCNTQQEVFSILDEFHRLEWNDNERALMSRIYIPLVTNFMETQRSCVNYINRLDG